MAARLSSRGIGLALVLAVAVGVAACAPATSGQEGGQPQVPAVTPEGSHSPQIQGTVALVTNALAAANIRADLPLVPYQPAEPADLGTAQRVVLQADVHDPAGGYIVIYDLTDTTTAAARGAEFAAYLESGFGQTNFTLDAQFSLAQVGSTLVFTWWSSALSDDKATAQAAFNAIASVGVPIPIIK